MARKTFVCPSCGSTKIRFDASAFWDEDLQEYVLYDVWGETDPICDDCGEEGKPIEKELVE